MTQSVSESLVHALPIDVLGSYHVQALHEPPSKETKHSQNSFS